MSSSVSSRSSESERSSNAAGTEMAQFVDFLRRAGQPAVLSANGHDGWVPGVRAELQRLPMECASPVSTAELHGVFSQPRTWVASYMQEPSADRPANCFDYVCTDATYDVEKLSKNGRRDVRRGLRCFQVRRCTWEELVGSGFQAYADTEVRHGHRQPEPAELTEMASLYRSCPFVDIWGAWDNQQLAAWVKVVRVDDWAFITTACSANEFLRNCPNNAVAYEATKHLLVEQKRKVVSFGISSLQATPNLLSLHKFKIRMGYQPVPMCRTFAVYWLVRPLVRPAAMSWLWDRLAAVRPHSATFSKVAGLARLLSGRASDPLAWAQADGDEAERQEAAHSTSDHV